MRQYTGVSNNARRIVFRRAETGTVGFLHIKITISFGVRVGNQRSCMVANHRSRIVSGKLPHREYTAFFLFLDQRADKGFIQFRIYNCHQRMISTESIPQGEYRVHRFVHTALMRFQIHTEITSVCIRKEIGLQTGVIKGCIKHRALVGILRTDIYFGQIVIPCLTCCTPHSVKIPSGYFGLHILTRSVHIDSRNTYFHQYLFILCRRELQQNFSGGQKRTAFFQCHRIRHQCIGKRLGKLGIEVDILVECPIYRFFMSADFGITDYFYFHFLICLTLDTVIKVQNETGIFGFRKGITVNGGTLCRSEFRLYVIAFQQDGIISGLRHFIIVRESRTVRHLLTLRPHRMILLFPYSRHQQYITVVRTSCSANMGMRETVDGSILVIVSGTSVPFVDACIGTGLNHPVRNNRTRICMSMSACPDKGIYIRGIVLLCLRTAKDSTQQQESAQQYGIRFQVCFHILWYYIRIIKSA